MSNDLLKNVKPRKVYALDSKVRPRQVKSCEVCGEEFLIPKARLNTARFCSFRCRGIAQKQKTWNIRLRHYSEFKCRDCGKIFKRVKRRYGTGSNPKEPQFCNRVCYAHFLRNKPSRSSIEQTKREREAKNQQCIICDFERFVEIAHILPASLNGSYRSENILYLCPNHHRLFDSNMLSSEEEEIIYDQVLTALDSDNVNKIHTARFWRFLRHWKRLAYQYRGKKTHKLHQLQDDSFSFMST